jgi:uracil-DNA glycosylase
MGMSDDDAKWPTARPFVPSTRSVSRMRRAAADCRGCPLFERATQTVFGQGPAPTPLMLVGEQPGDQEDRQGLPFVGPAGDVLARALEAAGITRDLVYVSNVVKHFKWVPRGKRRIHQTPRWSEIKACLPWTEAEVKAVAPRVVVCLGSTAAKALMGSSFRVTQSRGRVLQSRWAGIVVATWHPSAVLRVAHDAAQSRALFEQITDDLRLAAREARLSAKRRRSKPPVT